MFFWTTLLIIHGLLAIALLGAITHQTVALWLPARAAAGNFIARFRAVPSHSYVMAIIVLYLLTFVLGAWIYTHYRYTSRLALEQLRFFKVVGGFEVKEHLAVIGDDSASGLLVFLEAAAVAGLRRRPQTGDPVARDPHLGQLLDRAHRQ